MTDKEPNVPDYGQAPRDIVPPTAEPGLYRQLAEHDGQPVTLATGIVHEDIDGIPTAITRMALRGTLHLPRNLVNGDND